MKIYLDANFCCHLENDGTMQEIETDFFDKKCNTYIEGYRFIPAGQHWTCSDGITFYGQMIAPAINYTILEKAQQQYEADMMQAADMQEALKILGVDE